MANRLILGSLLSLALLLSPQMAWPTSKPAVKKKAAYGKVRRKSKTTGRARISSKSRLRSQAGASLASQPSPSHAASVDLPQGSPLKRVIPQRNGHFIVEPFKSKKTRSRFTGSAAKLVCAEVAPASVSGGRAFGLPNFRDLILTRAKTYQGTPYALGATLATDSATDCSGFVQYIYRGFQIDLPRTSAEQARVGKMVTRRMDFAKMLPGDLLFFRRGSRSVGHAGIYLGEGKMIHASNHQNGVVITDLRRAYYHQTFVVATRVFEMTYPDW